MPLLAGEQLGPYEILALIGAGGMGEVYRARDPRVNRDVAIKVSAAQFTERFEQLNTATGVFAFQAGEAVPLPYIRADQHAQSVLSLCLF